MVYFPYRYLWRSFFKQPEIEREEEGKCCDLRLGGERGGDVHV